jgi:hypothetical protein
MNYKCVCVFVRVVGGGEEVVLVIGLVIVTLSIL